MSGTCKRRAVESEVFAFAGGERSLVAEFLATMEVVFGPG